MKKKDNMFDNFNLLEERVLDTLDKSDLVDIRNKLLSIDKPTICTGVGGSSVVSEFASKVLNKKNNIITCNMEVRDILYRNINGYSNVLACSYSGNNLGVDISFENDLNKYLFSTREIDGICNLTYKSDIYKENSFISLGATIVPMSILLNYYLDGDSSVINEIIRDDSLYEVSNNMIYEILGGYEDSSACKFLESTMIESGIGLGIVHDKYSYCHGRSTTSYHNNSSLIFFDNDSELDQLYNELLGDYYNEIIKLSKKYDDYIINDFYLTYQSMLLCKCIASNKNMDLSRVQYSPVVKKLYKYSGKM